MKTILNLLIGFCIIMMASDCENNASATATNYSNFIICMMILGMLSLLRIYHKDFYKYLNNPSHGKNT